MEPKDDLVLETGGEREGEGFILRFNQISRRIKESNNSGFDGNSLFEINWIHIEWVLHELHKVLSHFRER